jgi:hypothetical protein
MRANLTPKRYYMDCFVRTNNDDLKVLPTTCYGWPRPFHFVVEHEHIPAGYTPYNIGEFVPLRKAANADYVFDDRFMLIPIDLFVWVCIVLGTVLGCEFAIRWRHFSARCDRMPID